MPERKSSESASKNLIRKGNRTFSFFRFILKAFGGMTLVWIMIVVFVVITAVGAAANAACAALHVISLYDEEDNEAGISGYVSPLYTDNSQIIYDILTTYGGLDTVHACAVMGNIYQESGLIYSTRVPTGFAADGSPLFAGGLLSWSDLPGGTREFSKIEDASASENTSWDNLEFQVRYTVDYNLKSVTWYAAGNIDGWKLKSEYGAEDWIAVKAAKILKKNANVRMTFFLISLFIIYCFFFTSKLWMHPGSLKQTLYYTEVGTSEEYCGHTVTLTGWKYCRSTHEMQVRVSVYDTGYTGENNFSFSAVTQDSTELPVTVQCTGDSSYVLKISDVPEVYDSISLRLLSASAEKRLKLYTLYDKVDAVFEIKWYDDYKWYQRDDLLEETETYEKLLQEEKEQLSESQEKFKNCEELIDSLNAEFALATAEKKSQLQSRLSSESTTKRSLETEIDAEQKRIEEYEAIITRDRELIKHIELGDSIE